MKRNIIYLSLCLAVLVFFMFKIIDYQKTINENTERYNKGVDQLKHVTDDYLYSYSLDNLNVDENLILINELGSRFKLKELLDKKNKLIILHNSHGCTPCIENVIDPLVRKFAGYDYSDIIFLTTTPKNRDILIFKNTYNYPGQIFRVSSKKLPASLRESKGTVLFLMNNTCNVFCAFQADKRTPEITVKYLTIIYDRYFK